MLRTERRMLFTSSAGRLSTIVGCPRSITISDTAMKTTSRIATVMQTLIPIFKIRFRMEKPNDPKLSDRGARRAGCKGRAKKGAKDV